MPSITIHRGTHQIGGCVTEISAGCHRLFVDIGDNLPGAGAPLPPIDGLTFGDGSDSALLLTHYHGDHIGRLGDVLPGMPIHMGSTAKALAMNLETRKRSDQSAMLAYVNGFAPLERIEHGGITITPLMIDHSAFDAYMFLIEAEGLRILHTGDFRLHGIRGGKTLAMLAHYAGNIDYIICEGTTLSRDGQTPMSEPGFSKERKR